MEFNESLSTYFKDQKVEVTLFPEENIRKFRSLKAFYEFALKEKEFWEPCTNGLARQIRDHFITLINHLVNASKASDTNQAINYLKHAINLAKHNNFPCVYSVTAIGRFVIERYNNSYFQADGVCDYLLQNKISGISNKEYLRGILFSFSISDLPNQSSLIENQNQSLDELRQRFSDELETLHNDYENMSDKDRSDTQLFRDLIIDWKAEIENNTEVTLREKLNKLSELENLYEEKLRLEGPATYWKGMSDDYLKKGEKWKNFAIVSTVVFILYLTILLYNLPESWTSSTILSINSVKSTIIFALIASIGVYLINLFVKLSVSAYHLARDADERFQLTYVYLSLLNEKGVGEAERSIVLQSLFSRADTGLLKGDSGPTLPDGVLSQAFKSIKQ